MATRSERDRLVAAVEAGLGNQVLPDSHGVPALTQPQLDGFAERFASTGRRPTILTAETGQRNRLGGPRVGGHLLGQNGRFCRVQVGGHLVG